MDKTAPVLFVDYCGVRDKYAFLAALSDALAPRPLVVIDKIISNRDAVGLSIQEALPRAMLSMTLPARLRRMLKRRPNAADDLSALTDQLLGLWGERQAHPNRRDAERVLAWTYRFTRASLAKHLPGLMIVWNQFHPLSRVALMAAASCGVPVAFVEYGMLPGTLSFDFSGQMGESDVVQDSLNGALDPLSPDDLRRGEAALATLVGERSNRRPQEPLGSTRDAVVQRAAGRPIILFAGHNDNASGTFPYDENAKRNHSPIFASSREAAEYLADIARENGWFLIYKPHPFAAKAQAIPETDHVAVFNDYDIHDCVELADCVTTTVSQVSYVALLHRKPLAMFGYNQLRGSGCCFQANRLEEVVPGVRAVLDSGFTEAQEAAFTRHVARLLRDYLYELDGNTSPLASARPISDLAAAIETRLGTGRATII